MRVEQEEEERGWEGKRRRREMKSRRMRKLHLN